MAKDSRDTALKILMRCRKTTCTLDRALDDFTPDLSAMTPKDRNLCHAIVFGVLRHRGHLDFFIRKFSKIPLEKLETRVMFLLRIALFQIIYMDKIPDFAAINTSVELAKSQSGRKAAGKKTAGFVNGLLRNAAASHAKQAMPDRDTAPADYLCHVLSMPRWLAKRWIGRYGPDRAVTLCRATNQIPSLTLRVNTLKTSREHLGAALEQDGHTVRFTEFSPDGICLTGSGARIEDIPGFADGLFQIQDEAAQLVSRLLAPQPGETILDACAGLGGKTFHLAQLMENKGQVVSADTDAGKLDSLSREAERLGVSIVLTRPMDLKAATVKDFPGFFDRVLVDAPCTGLGVLRRNPDSKWKRNLQDIRRMAAQQKKLLNQAAGLVRPGGVLVFAVCSCEPEENEDVIRAFLKKRKDYRLDTDPGLPRISENAYIKTFPEYHEMDGFFAARLLRLEKDAR